MKNNISNHNYGNIHTNNSHEEYGEKTSIFAKKVLKGAIKYLIPLIIVAVAIGSLLCYVAKMNNIADFQMSQEMVINRQAVFLDDDMDYVFYELLYFVSLDNNILWGKDGATPEVLQKFEESIVMKMNVTNFYVKVAIFDIEGNEILRIDRQTKKIVATPVSELQNKADRYYFNDALELEPGQIYVSGIDLLAEYGDVVQPERPVIRFIKLLRDNLGKAKGMLVLYYDADILLERMSLVERDHQNLMLLNSEGYWLSGTESDKKWGFVYPERETETFEKYHPEVWEEILTKNNGRFVTSEGSFVFTKVDLFKPLDINYLTEDGSFPMILVSFVPNNILAAENLNSLVWPIISVSSITFLLAIIILFIIRERLSLSEETNKMRKMYYSVVNTQQELIARYLPDTTLTFVNDAYCKAFGKSFQELVGQKYLRFLPVDQHEEEIASIKRLSLTQPSNTREYEVIFPDGRTGWQEWSDIGIFNESGELIEIQGVGRDMTERKQAEEALRTSEERFRDWIENSSDVITVIGLDGTIQYESPSIEHTLGYKPEELIGTNAFDLIHPDDRDRVMETLAQNIQKPQNTAFAEFRLRHDDGSWRVFEGLGKTFLDEHGRMAGLINSRDITNRKQSEQALRVSEIRYRALFEQAHFAVIILDLEGRHLEANRRAADMLGYTFEELLKISVNETSTELVESNKSLKRLIAGEHIPLYERFFQKKSGEVFPVEIHLELVRDDEGRPLHIQSVVRDITVQKQAEERIQNQLQRLASLRAIDTALLGSIDLQYTLNVVVQQTAAQLGVDAVTVLLLNPHTQTLTYAAGAGFRSQAIESSCVRLGEGHAGRAALTRHVVSDHNFRETEIDFVRAALLVGEDFTCHHAVPLVAKGKVNGVLEVFVRSHRESGEDWAEFLETFAGQAAIAIDNANLFSDLQHANVDLALAYDTTIEDWSNALDLRDKETEGHSKRVTEITMKLARAAGITEEELVHVRRGALLHDIGKMGIPDHILLKPDKLTDEEWVEMRKHPIFAFDLLSPIEYLRPALDIPYCHHEKWDGGGYPRGLKGEQIPLAARLFAIADVWDALLSDRPYRQSWSKEKVIEHIKSLSGTHFDPKAVELFLNLMINDEKDAG